MRHMIWGIIHVYCWGLFQSLTLNMANNNTDVCFSKHHKSCLSDCLETGLGKRAKKEHMSAICIKLLSHDPRTRETSVQVNNDVKSDGTAANGPSLYCMDPICEARPVLRGWETLSCCKLAVSYGRKKMVSIHHCPRQGGQLRRYKSVLSHSFETPQDYDFWNSETRQTGWTIQLNDGSKGQIEHLGWMSRLSAKLKCYRHVWHISLKSWLCLGHNWVFVTIYRQQILYSI